MKLRWVLLFAGCVLAARFIDYSREWSPWTYQA